MLSPGSIFISYRRSDSIAETGRLYDHLESHFGRNRVFKASNDRSCDLVPFNIYVLIRLVAHKLAPELTAR